MARRSPGPRCVSRPRLRSSVLRPSDIRTGTANIASRRSAWAEPGPSWCSINDLGRGRLPACPTRSENQARANLHVARVDGDSGVLSECRIADVAVHILECMIIENVVKLGADL